MAIKQLAPSPAADLTLTSPRDYFTELVEQGFHKKQFRPPTLVQDYLINLLEHYMDARNLFHDEVDESTGQKKHSTLAETYLRAMDPTVPERFELLKNLGDRTLYISGFFGDSLNRKLVDIDYYAGVGGAAYGNLAEISHEEFSTVYRTFSKNFLDFVDVLTYISQKSFVQNDEGILRLYDRYLKTGSEMARDRLVEMGVIPLASDQLKNSRQD